VFRKCGAAAQETRLPRGTEMGQKFVAPETERGIGESEESPKVTPVISFPFRRAMRKTDKITVLFVLMPVGD
jgi:hypothetical protein